MTDHSPAAVAKALRSIEDMAGRLEARAIDRANDREMPGGDALVNLASVGSMAEWNRRQDAREEAGGPAAWDTSSEDPDELWPAVQILAFWSEDYRSCLGMRYDNWRPTLVTEAKFLRNHDVAEWIWANEVHWDDYAGDVMRAQAKLESVLVEGERAERTRVECDRCEVDPPRLIKKWAPGADADDDQWKCPRCKHIFDSAARDRAHAKQLRSEKADKLVALPDAMGTLVAQGRPERTIRKWLAPPAWLDRCAECGKAYAHQERNTCRRKVKDPESKAWVECGGFVERAELVDPEAVVVGYCEVSTHKTWVYWPDLWRLHLTTPTRKRAAVA